VKSRGLRTDVFWGGYTEVVPSVVVASAFGGRCARAYGWSIRSGFASTCNHCVGERAQTVS
jgi:hypothetical protein